MRGLGPCGGGAVPSTLTIKNTEGGPNMDRTKFSLAFDALSAQLQEQGFDVCYLALQGSQN